jgi:hypothetical protein
VPLDYTAEGWLQEAVEAPPLSFVAHAETPARALALATATGERFIRDAASRAEAARAASIRERQRAREQAARANAAVAVALARDGIIDLQNEGAAIDTQIREREATRSALLGQAAEAQATKDVLQAAAAGLTGRKANEELAVTQRALSVALAQTSLDDAHVNALRQRIQRLKAKREAPLSASVSQRARVRAHQSHVTQLDQELQELRQKRAALTEVRARHADLLASAVQADALLSQSEARVRALEQQSGRAQWTKKPLVVRLEGRALRAAVAVVTPALALFLAVMLVLLNEVRDLRVSSPAELSYWMRLPVVATSRWPAEPSRLESLIDELSEAVLEARGTTLVLAGDEHERPLANTIAAQLNARAQRHFRSATGARVTVAQGWEGDLSGSHLRRATEIADRVLWVISAGNSRGPELRMRRAEVTRTSGQAAILVDVRHRHLPSQVGDAEEFWSSESTLTLKRIPSQSERVPLH